mmetsp:Transcript_34703/g.55563  ORF Transcript_34703/g.55563 Transcript_34703/m.55563 type:complete len:701 (-) Transcript_34703:317-2419(-)
MDFQLREGLLICSLLYICAFGLFVASAVISWDDLVYHDLVLVLLSMLCFRLMLTIAVGAVQLSAVSRLTKLNDASVDSLSGPYDITKEELDFNRGKENGFSLYTLLSFLLGIVQVCWAVELGLAIALLVIVKHLYQILPWGFIPAITCFWVSLVGRLFISTLPFKWRGFFGNNSNLWFSHNRARFGGCFRWFMLFLCCDNRYLCGKTAYEPVLKTVCEQDQVSAAASSLAYLLKYRAAGLSHHEVLGLLGKLIFDTEGDVKEGKQVAEVAIGTWDMDMLYKATELMKYAIAAYTGPLMDIPRLSLFCCLGKCFCRCGKQENEHAYLAGDSCRQGNRSRFAAYLREDGQVRKGAICKSGCEVTYFLLTRKASQGDGREIVLSIRGTQHVYDVLSDSFMFPAPLRGSDLGTDGEADDGVMFGNGHLGMLLCARSLVKEVRGLLLEMVDGLEDKEQRPIPIWIVGHSLGAGVSTLCALALRNLFPREKAIVTGIAYQPLPTLDATALAYVRTHAARTVFSIPFDDDIVSRLSLRRLNRLSEKMLRIKERDEKSKSPLSDNWCCSILWGARFMCSVLCTCLWKAGDRVSAVEKYGRARAIKGLDTHEPDKGSIHDTEGVIEDQSVILMVKRESDVNYNYSTLFVAGHCIHIQRNGNDSFCARPVDPATDHAFVDIILSKDTLLDHMPWRLEYALVKVLGLSFEK